MKLKLYSDVLSNDTELHPPKKCNDHFRIMSIPVKAGGAGNHGVTRQEGLKISRSSMAMDSEWILDGFE